MVHMCTCMFSAVLCLFLVAERVNDLVLEPLCYPHVEDAFIFVSLKVNALLLLLSSAILC